MRHSLEWAMWDDLERVTPDSRIPTFNLASLNLCVLTRAGSAATECLLEVEYISRPESRLD